MKSYSNNKGFTLVEVIVSVGIAISLIGAIIVNYNAHNDTQTLKQAALTLKNDLRLAQSKALAGEKPASDCTELVGYSITFSVGSYSLRAQCSPEGAIGPTTTVTLPSGVTFSPLPSSFTFRVLSRGTTLAGVTPITLMGFAKSYRLEVSTGGDISDKGLQ